MTHSPHLSNKPKQGLILSTSHKHGSLHSHYKHLGVRFYTQDSAAFLTDIITNTIHSFFSEMAPLDLKCREIVLLINSSLTPILTYRMMAHSLPEATILKLDSLICTRLVNTAKDSGLASIPPNTSGAFNYSIPSAGGLKMNFIHSELLRQNIHLTNRFLMKEAQADASNSVISALCSHTHNSFQQSVMNSAYFFRACMFGVPTMNPCNPRDLTSDTSVRVKFNTGAFPGTIVNTQTNTATVFLDVD